MAVFVSAITALCYVFASKVPALLLFAIFLILLRMTLNTLDGIIAIERGNLSLKGEIVNALPDRYSDIFLIAGIAFSPLCHSVLGFLGLASMFLVSYTGMMGKALGVDWQHHGPLGKVERLIFIMIFSLMQYIALKNNRATMSLWHYRLTYLEWNMVLFIVLGQVTVFRRLRGIWKQITKLEWVQNGRKNSADKKILVVYDSHTGNTERVAREISECLGADLKKVEHVTGLDGYDVIVLGSPNIRKRPTKKMINFLNNHTDIKQYAVFITYGMPGWGMISTPMCFSYIKRTLGRKPLGAFACKGYHAKYKTYKGHPSPMDLHDAFLFGITLSNKLRIV